MLRPLELARRPEHAAHRLYDDAVIDRELERLAAEQRDDGAGRSFEAWNPVVGWEWRGVATFAALHTLRASGRLREEQGANLGRSDQSKEGCIASLTQSSGSASS